MGRLTQYRQLPDQAYDHRITDLERPLRPPRGKLPDGSPDTWQNRNRTNTTAVQLVAGQSLRLLPYNARRTGLLIQNKDPATALNFSFANDQAANGASLAPGQFALFDFTTPPDELYLFSAANIAVVVIEFTRRQG